MTGERWRTPASRTLTQAIRRAGGHCQLISLGRLLVTGPDGQVAVPEPESLIRNLHEDATVKLIIERTGLQLTRG